MASAMRVLVTTPCSEALGRQLSGAQNSQQTRSYCSKPLAFPDLVQHLAPLALGADAGNCADERGRLLCCRKMPLLDVLLSVSSGGRL
jgi:hypothetical protein